LVKNIAHIAPSLAVKNIKNCVKIANAVEILERTLGSVKTIIFTM